MTTPTPAPTPNTNKNTRDIELTVELDASPEDVFRAVTVGTEIAKWLPAGAPAPPPRGRAHERPDRHPAGGGDERQHLDLVGRRHERRAGDRDLRRAETAASPVRQERRD